MRSEIVLAIVLAIENRVVFDQNQRDPFEYDREYDREYDEPSTKSSSRPFWMVSSLKCVVNL